ncbi:hypothetical protein [Niabella aquatica]
MRLKYIKLWFLIGALLIINILIAQEIPGRENDGVKKAENEKRGMYDGLNLTKVQQKQLQQLNKGNRQAVKDILADSNLTDGEKKERMRAIKQQQVEKRKTIFTQEQNVRYEENVRKFRKNSHSSVNDKNVINNVIRDKERDANGLSKNIGEKVSKENRAAWNELNLNQKQKEQIKLWNDEYASRLRIIRNDITLKGDQKQEQIAQLVREQDLQLSSILTAGQKSIWDERLRQQKMSSTPRQIRNNPRLYYLK